jgi:hypothetical protein
MNFSPEIKNIIDKNLVKKLKSTYKDAGYLYILSRPHWGTIHKFGETDDVIKRFGSYNGHDAIPVCCESLMVCTEVKKIEKEMKKSVLELKYNAKEKSSEWVTVPPKLILEIFHNFSILDNLLSEECGIPIYKFKTSVISEVVEKKEVSIIKTVTEKNFTFLIKNPEYVENFEKKDIKSFRVDVLPVKPFELRIPKLEEKIEKELKDSIYYNESTKEWIANVKGNTRIFSAEKFGYIGAYNISLMWAKSEL